MNTRAFLIAIVAALTLASAPLAAQRRVAARPTARPPRAQAPRAVPRGTVGRAPGVIARGRNVAPPRVRAYPEPRIYGYARPRHIVPVIVYPRPYFAFRPRFWLGYGLWTGVPVPYPIDFGYPAYVYGYAENGAEVAAPPANDQFGGVSFDITPPDASVSVDGESVGVASDFSPTHQPLTLTPGRHHVELQAPGMVPVAFDVDVIAGQVIPYKGTLNPQ